MSRIQQSSLIGALRARTKELHQRAERSGIVVRIMRGEVTACDYALYLRNLLPAYVQLEAGLESHRWSPCHAGLARPELYRASAIEADLAALCGPDWASEMPVLESGRRYAERVEFARGGDGSRLIAHAYTRYMGDLSGGQILGRMLGRAFGAAGLSFYDFSGISDQAAFKAAYIAAIEQAGALVVDLEQIVAEAEAAFALNIAVSIEVDTARHSLSAVHEHG